MQSLIFSVSVQYRVLPYVTVGTTLVVNSCPIMHSAVSNVYAILPGRSSQLSRAPARHFIDKNSWFAFCTTSTAGCHLPFLICSLAIGRHISITERDYSLRATSAVDGQLIGLYFLHCSCFCAFVFVFKITQKAVNRF